MEICKFLNNIWFHLRLLLFQCTLGCGISTNIFLSDEKILIQDKHNLFLWFFNFFAPYMRLYQLLGGQYCLNDDETALDKTICLYTSVLLGKFGQHSCSGGYSKLLHESTLFDRKYHQQYKNSFFQIHQNIWQQIQNEVRACLF